MGKDPQRHREPAQGEEDRPGEQGKGDAGSARQILCSQIAPGAGIEKPLSKDEAGYESPEGNEGGEDLEPHRHPPCPTGLQQNQLGPEEPKKEERHGKDVSRLLADRTAARESKGEHQDHRAEGGGQGSDHGQPEAELLRLSLD
jgi:hypothetical protein